MGGRVGLGLGRWVSGDGVEAKVVVGAVGKCGGQGAVGGAVAWR